MAFGLFVRYGARVLLAVPEVALWLGPTLVFTPLFIWLGRREERRRS